MVTKDGYGESGRAMFYREVHIQNTFEHCSTANAFQSQSSVLIMPIE